MDQSRFDSDTIRRDWFAEVYQAIDTVFDRHGGNVPPGTLAMLYRAVDGLRDTGGWDAQATRASAMVLTLHRLQAMLRARVDTLAVAEVRRDLAQMLREFLLEAPVLH